MKTLDEQNKPNLRASVTSSSDYNIPTNHPMPPVSQASVISSSPTSSGGVIFKNEINIDHAYFDSFPPGYRFRPHDEELIRYYLRNKIDDLPLPKNRIVDVDLYQHHPETLAEKYKQCGEKEWYFFTPREKKYKHGLRPSRSTGEGYWKATGADRPIKYQGHVVGFRKALVFYIGKAPKGDKTNWIMHEFRVNDSSQERRQTKKSSDDMTLDKWVLCRIYKKTDKPNVRNRQRDEEFDQDDDQLQLQGQDSDMEHYEYATSTPTDHHPLYGNVANSVFDEIRQEHSLMAISVEDPNQWVYPTATNMNMISGFRGMNNRFLSPYPLHFNHQLPLQHQSHRSSRISTLSPTDQQAFVMSKGFQQDPNLYLSPYAEVASQLDTAFSSLPPQNYKNFVPALPADNLSPPYPTMDDTTTTTNQ